MTCQDCRENLLHFLFDLLDADEVQSLQEHLAQCASCREALDEARSQKSTLQSATRASFPEVTFEVPAEDTQIQGSGPAGSRPSGSRAGSSNKNAPQSGQKRSTKAEVLAAGAPSAGEHESSGSARISVWSLRRMVFVASLALAFGGTVSMSVWGWWSARSDLSHQRYQLAQANINASESQAKLQQRRREIQEEIRRLQNQVNKLVKDWNEDSKRAQQEFRQKNVGFSVQGPRSLQAGGRSQYLVQMEAKKGKPGTPVPTAEEALVRIRAAKSKKVVYEARLQGMGNAKIDLPQNVPVEPGDQYYMEVATLDSQGDVVKVSDHLGLVQNQYLTHLALDRPMYKPGETVYFRSLTLERYTLKQPGEDLHVILRITGPRGVEIFRKEGLPIVTDKFGNKLAGPDGEPLHGIACESFPLPSDIPGGEYILHVDEAKKRFPPEQQRFLVQQWQPNRLHKELVFHRKTYGPGDEVIINASVRRVDGSQLVGESVNLVATADGQRIAIENRNTDASGKVTFRFHLPRELRTGTGSVSLTFHDSVGGNMPGGMTETLVRPLPLVSDRLLIDFYPEGGDLVAGVKSRVYFQVRTPTGKPADILGKLMDQDGMVVTRVQTLKDDEQPGVNQGMGEFAFTPRLGQRYRLVVDSPIGIRGNFILPQAKTEGVVLNVPEGVAKEKIDVNLTSVGRDRNLFVGAYCRGKLLDHIQVRAAQDRTVPATLHTTDGVAGVYRITVFEDRAGALLPVAERLVYRRPQKKLQLELTASKQKYQPGQKVKLSMRCSDESGAAAPATVTLSVVDKRVINLVDDKTMRTMPTHFLLTSEVRRPQDLEYADFLVSEGQKAGQALDLLLGTQGWRRFAEQQPDVFLKRQKREAERLLLAMGNTAENINVLEQDATKSVDEQYTPKFVALQKELAAQEAGELGPPQLLRQVQNAASEVNQSANEVRRAEREMRAYRLLMVRIVLGTLMAGAILAGFLFLFVGLRRLNAGQRAQSPFLIGSLCLGSVLFVGCVFTLATMGSRDTILPGFIDRDAWDQVAANMAVEQAPMDAEKALEPRRAEPNAGDPAPMDPAAIEPGAMDFGAMGGPGLPPIQQRRFGGLEGFGADLAAAQPVDDLDEGLFNRGGLAPGQARMGDFAMANGMALEDRAPMQDMDRLDALQRWNRGRQSERMLRRAGNYQQLASLRLGRYVPAPDAIGTFPVREYAHRHMARPDSVRHDFASTLYWNPALVLKDGKDFVEFDLSDSVSTFQVLAFAHAPDGRLGAAVVDLTSSLPYSVDPQVPAEVTQSDNILVPILGSNDTEAPVTAHIQMFAKNLVLKEGDQRDLVIPPGKRSQIYLPAQPTIVAGKASVRVDGLFSSNYRDRVERTLQVVPDGFPIEESKSGLLEGFVQETFTLPETWVQGTLTCKVQVFPSVLADLQQGLEGMLREPSGCFEQASSSNYPNVMIMNYLKQTNQSAPETERQARKLMESGYQKLTSYESPSSSGKRKGYEWFGQNPPHEALTAYGLLQFHDMAKVFPVDEAMLKRTREFLLAQRDGKGGFRRNPQAIDSFGRAPQHITDAYIVWALTETGDDDLKTEIDALAKKASSSRDPYFLSLVGLSLLNTHRPEGLDVLKQLASLQQKDGELMGETMSITGSSGRTLAIETTALCVLGWLKANRPDQFQTVLNKSIRWLGKQRSGAGGFGATQSTILALKALVAHTRQHQQDLAGAHLAVTFGDVAAPIRREVPAQATEPLTIELPAGHTLLPGANRVRCQLTGNQALPYTLSWSYRTLKPANPEKCPVHLKTSLSKTQARLGESLQVKLEVDNKSGKGQGMAVAIIGLPAGLTLPPDLRQLRELARMRDNDTRPGVIGSFEIKGRELILYWRDLAPDAHIELDLDVICTIPGQYRGPAGRAYLYYDADRKFWIDPLSIDIQP